MKRITLPLVALSALILALAAPAAEAACRVEYKAKQDNPLRLNFGTMDLPDEACESKKAAASILAPILKQQGWTLLSVVSIFGKN